MTQYYIRTDGHDSANGTTDGGGNPVGAWLTFQHAIDTMVAGDICTVHTGTYAQSLSTGHSGSAGSYITLQAATGETVTIRPDGGGDMCDFQTVSYLYFKNIIFDGNNIASSCCNLSQASHHNKFENCEFKNSAVSGVSTQRNIGASDVGQNEFINCNLHHCLGHGYYFETFGNIVYKGTIHDVGENTGGGIQHGYGVHIYSDAGVLGAAASNIVHSVTMYNLYEAGVLIGGPNNLIYNNLIYGNNPSGSTGYQTRSGVEMGFYTTHSPITGNKIYNNTIYGCLEFGISYHDSNGATIKNNMFYANTLNGVWDHHLHGLAGSNTNSTVSNNFNGLQETVNPGFTNVSAFDFTLTSHHLGANLSGEFTDDLAGLTRVNWDIGAYEFEGTDPPPDPPPGTDPTDGIFSQVTVGTLTAADGTVQLGATLRNSEDVDANRDHYFGTVYNIGADFYTDIGLMADGSSGYQTLTTTNTTVAWSSGDLLRLDCVGTGTAQLLILRKNGTEVIRSLNSTLPSPDRYGFLLDGNTNEAVISAWAGGTIDAGVATTVNSSSFTGTATVLGSSHGFEQQYSGSVISIDGSGNATCNPRSSNGVDYGVAKWIGATSQPPTTPTTNRIFIRLV